MLRMGEAVAERPERCAGGDMTRAVMLSEVDDGEADGDAEASNATNQHRGAKREIASRSHTDALLLALIEQSLRWLN